MEKYKEKSQQLYEELEHLEKEVEKKREEWYTHLELFKSKCSHTLPNGESAWEHGYILSRCQICDLNDL